VKRRFVLKSGAAFGAGLLFLPSARAQNGVLNIYSARHYNTDEALYGNFADLSGIKINRIDAEPDPLVERLKAEGDKSPCDIFLTTDAGRIERARQLGLLQPVVSEVLAARVPAHLRDPDNSWFGFSKRARVIVYNKEKVPAADAPKTYEALADARWKGKLLIRSSGHIYNQSLVGSLLAALGPEKTEAWARGVAANLARPPRGGDTDQIKGVASGECSIGVTNTYYLARIMRSTKPEDQALMTHLGVVFPNQADWGTHVNIAGGGVARHAKNIDHAVKFLEYLVSPTAQQHFANGNNEWPVARGVKLDNPALQAMTGGAFKSELVPISAVGMNQFKVQQMLDRVGLK